MHYFIEVVWNREFDWSTYGEPYATPEKAVEVARALINSGDGARVKKARIVNDDGIVVIPVV